MAFNSVFTLLLAASLYFRGFLFVAIELPPVLSDGGSEGNGCIQGRNQGP